jgi:hypothetical protein
MTILVIILVDFFSIFYFYIKRKKLRNENLKQNFEKEDDVY